MNEEHLQDYIQQAKELAERQIFDKMEEQKLELILDLLSLEEEVDHLFREMTLSPENDTPQENFTLTERQVHLAAKCISYTRLEILLLRAYKASEYTQAAIAINEIARRVKTGEMEKVSYRKRDPEEI